MLIVIDAAMESKIEPTTYFIAERMTLEVPSTLMFHQAGPPGIHAPTVDGKKDDLVGVAVADYNIGNHLLTNNLAPCQAVIVRFSNGEFGLYHASTPYTKSKGGTEETVFDHLQKACKDRDIDEVIILEKIAGNKNNQAKAPLLAVGISEHLVKDPNKVKRLQVNDYFSVYCNATTHEVLICKQITVKQDPNQQQINKTCSTGFEQLTLIHPTEEKVIQATPRQVGKLIPYTQSVDELRQLQANGKFLDYTIKAPLTEEQRVEQLVFKLDKVRDELAKYPHVFSLKPSSPIKNLIDIYLKRLNPETCKSEQELDKMLVELVNNIPKTSVGGFFCKGKDVKNSMINKINILKTALALNLEAPTSSITSASPV
jgi:hypothetical protein